MQSIVKDRLIDFLSGSKIKHAEFCESIIVSKRFISALRNSIHHLANI